ncbi:hypothetical protein [Aeropyrum pernix]|nr:hypothetical protein [Aeropyrum pernix]
MGRTAAPGRVLVEAEVERLRRLLRHLRSGEDRRLLEDLLSSYRRVLEAYRYVPMSDPMEPVYIAMILEAARSCRGSGGEGGGEAHT